MNRNRRQNGAVIAETAVTIMVLFTLLFGILEFGRAFKTYQAMTDAAREGARFSVAPAPNNGPLPNAQQVADHVCVFLSAAHVPPAPTCPAQASTCPPAGTLPQSAAAGVYVAQNCTRTVNSVSTLFSEVDIKVPYTFIFFPFTVNMTTRAVMRNEKGN
jgi:Flp pilus assembly protein TadG